MSDESSRSAQPIAYLTTVPALRVPYGTLAVSPRYTKSSAGKAARMARATVRPPKPESKIPIGFSTCPV